MRLIAVGVEKINGKCFLVIIKNNIKNTRLISLR